MAAGSAGRCPTSCVPQCAVACRAGIMMYHRDTHSESGSAQVRVMVQVCRAGGRLGSRSAGNPDSSPCPSHGSRWGSCSATAPAPCTTWTTWWRAATRGGRRRRAGTRAPCACACPTNARSTSLMTWCCCGRSACWCAPAHPAQQESQARSAGRLGPPRTGRLRLLLRLALGGVRGLGWGSCLPHRRWAHAGHAPRQRHLQLVAHAHRRGAGRGAGVKVLRHLARPGALAGPPLLASWARNLRAPRQPAAHGP